MGGKTYLVQAEDGQFYGPADIAVLDQWAGEGRILAQTVLVEQGTNIRSLAADVPGLRHHFSHASPPGASGQGVASASPKVSPTTAQPAQPVAQNNPYSGTAHSPLPKAPLARPSHNPIVAVVLSVFLLACGGQFYNKQIKKAFVVLLAFVAAWYVLPIDSFAVTAIAAVDAYMIAAKIQRGETVREWEWF